jgi:hypothetical protein
VAVALTTFSFSSCDLPTAQETNVFPKWVSRRSLSFLHTVRSREEEEEEEDRP